MKAVVHYALEPCSVELREIAEPTPRAGEVLVRVRAVGVCGSDLHQYHNTQSWQVNVPVVLGHEFAGVIEAVGEGVQGWQVGDRVACETAAVICEQCAYCRTGRYNLCPQRLGFGYGVNGAMTRYVRAPARILHRLPDTLCFEDAAMTEPCSVAAHAVIECSQPKPGDLVVVFGSGPIGLLCLQMAKLFSPRKAILVGLSADGERLRIAEAVGADAILCADRDDIEAIVRREGDGQGAPSNGCCAWATGGVIPKRWASWSCRTRSAACAHAKTRAGATCRRGRLRGGGVGACIATQCGRPKRSGNSARGGNGCRLWCGGVKCTCG